MTTALGSPFLCRKVCLHKKAPLDNQEDVNGEKLMVKKWWIFGADFFTVLVPIFSRFTPIFHGL